MQELEIIFSEFGLRKDANQPAAFNDLHRLDPTYSSVKQYFPEAKFTFYTDDTNLGDGYDDIEIKVIPENEFIQNNHHRQGWNNSDYYQIQGLLNSTADIAISMD